MSPPLSNPSIPSSLRIRRLTEHDIPGVMAIESVSFGKHHWSDDSFYNELDNQMGFYFVLVDAARPAHDAVVGYAGYWLILEEGHITTIATHPERRGQSLGELLLLHLLLCLQEQQARLATLEVRCSNVTGQNLYYKYGFEGLGLRPHYYQDNHEDAIIMTLSDLSSKSVIRDLSQLREHLSQRVAFPPGFATVMPSA